MDNLLPVPLPKDYNPGRRYFYEKVLKPMIEPIIHICDNGQHIDLDKVNILAEELDKVINENTTKLQEHPLIKEYQKERYEVLAKDKALEYASKMKEYDHFLKEYKPKDITHRSYACNEYAKKNRCAYFPDTLLPTGELKWTIRDMKLAGIEQEHIEPYIDDAMKQLAIDKVNKFNGKYTAKIDNIDESILPPFNPKSPTQIKGLFKYLDVKPIAYSKDTGEASWGRDQLKELQYKVTGGILEIVQCLLNISKVKTTRTNFVENFIQKNYDGRIYHNLKLMGTLSARPSSGGSKDDDRVNGLNQPSTASPLSKPIKECFTAPKGKILMTLDYGQLEDRVIANLSKDKGKINVFKNSWDAHSYNSLAYGYKDLDELSKQFFNSNDIVFKSKILKKVKSEYKDIRQDSKNKTFKLA
jgi:hypothetical protein